MDAVPVVSMTALWPDLPEARRLYEVVISVPRDDEGGPLVPFSLPDGVVGCWSAGSATVSLTVRAARPSAAVAAAEVLAPDLANSGRAEVTVRPAGGDPRPPAAT